MQKLIDYIMDNFNFGDVYKTMNALDWKWGVSANIPTMAELRQTARRLLEDVSQEKVEWEFISSGGFTAWKYSTKAEGTVLRLCFCVDDIDCNKSLCE